MEHLVAEWIVRVWQNRALGEHAPAWGPGEEHSPNTLFAAAMNQGGFALQVPSPELYYELLPAHHVKIHAARGVKIGGLWYGKSDPAIEPYQGKLSDRGGQHKGKWVIRADRRDRRQVFFQDPADPAEWHVLRWNGLPPEGEVPAFSDKTAEELLGEARARGLSPRSDAELLPVLLGLLGGAGPGRAVAHPAGQEGEEGPRPRGRPGRPGSQRPARQPPAAAGGRKAREGGPLALARAGAQAGDALDAERRRRREQAVPQRPAPPGSLGDRLRRTSLLALPEEDEQ